MNYIQTLKNLSQVGTVKIESESYVDNEQLDNTGEYWYKVTLFMDGAEFLGYDPTLEGAIFTVKRQLEVYNTKINMGGKWNS